MANGTPVLPGGYNTHITTFDASGRLVTGYSRNPKDFALNKYVQIRDVKKKTGFYLKIGTEEAGRVINADLQDFVWPDGADRPQGNDGTEEFNFSDYRTKRYNYGYKIGSEADEQADWNVSETHEKIKAQQAMTARATKVHSVLATAGNWEADHVKDVTTIDGNAGPWDADTSVRADIERSLNYACEIIMKATLSVVRKKDLILVMNPTTAKAIALTQAIRDHIKQSPDAYKHLNNDSSQWDEYGLPSKLYGYNVVVEDAVRVSSRRGAATADRDWVMGDGVAYLMARPGGLIAPAGGPSFSTTTLFVKEDMTVEHFTDTENRRIKGNVVDDFDCVITASASGFYFTGLLT